LDKYNNWHNINCVLKGATALIAVMDPTIGSVQGFWYVLVPVLVGEGVLLLVALAIGNLSKVQRYPEYWV